MASETAHSTLPGWADIARACTRPIRPAPSNPTFNIQILESCYLAQQWIFLQPVATILSPLFGSKITK
jgi:hypothetical protein